MGIDTQLAQLPLQRIGEGLTREWVAPVDLRIEETDGARRAFLLTNGQEAKIGSIEKMSKSKKNVVDPDDIIDQYGADAVSVYEYNLGGNGKSQILATTGFIKLVQRTDGPVVGVHMIGSRIGEQIGEAQLIVNWEAFPEDVASLVHAHPTQNEAMGEAFLALAGKPLHAHA